ncbi:MAG TPA: response regulator, partial [Pyrinomonadaceae bacterium]|nr:response regulator [Pyrinomonadaceae bacterium]
MHETTNSIPTIFFVEEDNNARRSLTKSLRELGYRVLVSADLEDALEWTSGTSYIHADLVLINLLGKLPEEALTIGRRLREHSKYDGHTPLVVMPEKVPQDLQGTDERVS